MNLEYAYKTDVGRIRSYNEDAVAIFEQDDMLIMVVADGMGGHALGDVKSKMAIGHVANQFNAGLSFDTSAAASEWLTKTLSTINADILKFGKQHHTKNMGTTLVMAIVMKDFVVVANIGDSRAYLWAHDTLRQITRDHTFVAELVEKGQISERAAKVHPQKNVINKAMGASPQLDFDVLVIEHYALQGVLLCSDGLTRLIEDKEILEVLQTNLTVKEKVTTLIKKANDAGGRDNVTVALVSFGERSQS
jgi:protein phosphatase